MSICFLIRHGQTPFGAAACDQLSGKGTGQSRLLGAWFKRYGTKMDDTAVKKPQAMPVPVTIARRSFADFQANINEAIFA